MSYGNKSYQEGVKGVVAYQEDRTLHVPSPLANDPADFPLLPIASPRFRDSVPVFSPDDMSQLALSPCWRVLVPAVESSVALANAATMYE